MCCFFIGSAGIGRTGMLILMDTALSLLNVNEPVYPLDIVKHMRDQRPCMVQNVVSNREKSNHLKYEAFQYVLEKIMSLESFHMYSTAKIFSNARNQYNL